MNPMEWENPFEKLPKKRKMAQKKKDSTPVKKVKYELLFHDNLNILPLKEKKSIPEYVNSSIRNLLGTCKFTIPKNWLPLGPIFVVGNSKLLQKKTVNKIIFSHENDAEQVIMLALFLYSMIEGFGKLYLPVNLKMKMQTFSLGIALLRKCILLNFDYSD